jgi:hypothetical protein
MSKENLSILVASIISLFIGIFKAFNQNGWHFIYGIILILISLYLLAYSFIKKIKK